MCLFLINYPLVLIGDNEVRAIKIMRKYGELNAGCQKTSCLHPR